MARCYNFTSRGCCTFPMIDTKPLFARNKGTDFLMDGQMQAATQK